MLLYKTVHEIFISYGFSLTFTKIKKNYCIRNFSYFYRKFLMVVLSIFNNN